MSFPERMLLLSWGLVSDTMRTNQLLPSVQMMSLWFKGLHQEDDWCCRWGTELKRLRSQLNSWGVSGLLAYGLLNTIYYSAAFLIIWTYFARVPRGDQSPFLRLRNEE